MISRVISLRFIAPAAVIGLALACIRGGDDFANTSGDGDLADTNTDDDVCNPYPTTEVAGCSAVIGEGFCSESVMHVPIGTAITWDHEPPNSGDHYPVWETKGEHTEVVERGYWVHNLEHGWIVLIYNCPSGCDAELDVLRQVLTMRDNLDILMTSDPLLEGSKFAAISWTWTYAFDEPVLEDLLCFADQHYEHSPETVH